MEKLICGQLRVEKFAMIYIKDFSIRYFRMNLDDVPLSIFKVLSLINTFTYHGIYNESFTYIKMVTIQIILSCK